MTTSPDTQESAQQPAQQSAGVDSGFGRREISAAERELQEVLAAARALGIESEEKSAESAIDVTAVEALAAMELDRPVVHEATPIASFLQSDKPETEAEPAISVESIQEADAAWFAINTYTGHENRVRDALDLRIRNMDAEEQFVELKPEQAGVAKKGMAEKRFVLVPTQQEVEIRGGKRREVERKLLPGYVLLQIRLDGHTGELSDGSWHVVNGTAGVTGFVGTREDQRDRARPLPPAQVAKIIGQTQVEEPRVRVGFAVNDSVRLTDGPFLDMVAEVEEINIEKGKVRVRISMFGRETPLELDFDQVEKQ